MPMRKRKREPNWRTHPAVRCVSVCSQCNVGAIPDLPCRCNLTQLQHADWIALLRRFKRDQQARARSLDARRNELHTGVTQVALVERIHRQVARDGVDQRVGHARQLALGVGIAKLQAVDARLGHHDGGAPRIDVQAARERNVAGPGARKRRRDRCIDGKRDAVLIRHQRQLRARELDVKNVEQALVDREALVEAGLQLVQRQLNLARAEDAGAG